MVTAAITTIVIIMILNFVFDRYTKEREAKRAQLKDKLEVLKVISKHECFGKFEERPENFKTWVVHLLKLKGYKNPTLAALNDAKADKEIRAINKNGQMVYVACKLWDPQKWDEDITRAEAEKLVGQMTADGVRNGLMITTASIGSDTTSYLEKVKQKGYYIELIDGDSLINELYDLRTVHLKTLAEAF